METTQLTAAYRKTSAWSGLRAKSVLLFAACAAMIVALATVIGLQVVEVIKRHYGEAFAREHTQLYKQRILAPLNRELALAQRLASEESIRAFLREDGNPVLREAAFREAEAYRTLFAGKMYCLAAAATGHYFLNDPSLPFSTAPRYTLKPANPDDNWFFSLLGKPAPYQLNVSQDAHVKTTKVWINVMVGDAGKRLGLISGGLDLTAFLQEFARSAQAGVSSMVLEEQGAIMAHADPQRIQFQIAGSRSIDKTLARYLGSDADRLAVQQAMVEARANPDGVTIVEAVLDGKPQLFALAYIPELRWYAVTALDLQTAKLIAVEQFLPWLLAALLLLALLFALLMYGVDRGLLRPLASLTEIAQRFGRGEYQVRIASRRQDELGALANVFDRMAEQVDRHASELEQKVADRTHELAETNARMAVAHQHIQESLRYARLIQRSLLPEEEFRQQFGAAGLVWLQPRDVVGGDLFVYRSDASGTLFGVIDCAGHGVPGAFMTMLAHVAADLAIDEAGLTDPARLIALIDARVRSMLPADATGNLLATNMDAAFCHIDAARQQLVFAGAKLPAFIQQGGEVRILPAGRRAIAERRQGEWHNQSVPLNGVAAVYLATDGLFDQSGGEDGFGLGEARFAQWLLQLSGLPASVREERLTRLMLDWRAEREQRDDMAVLGVLLGAASAAAQGEPSA
ncbi:biofilm regulation protein phosphatase SiaA [Chitinilyticum litopenaei]|uniref:biofilm regulation protein phosphatase SiaA n=1 Tax=Chitinilyticum litopenaei TaxID=1121276 RepID=UPI000685AF97|nr:biofilm regulation protein phosphatase SiaA [Chitinilyticum litopenaei]